MMAGRSTCGPLEFFYSLYSQEHSLSKANQKKSCMEKFNEVNTNIQNSCHVMHAMLSPDVWKLIIGGDLKRKN